MNGHSSRLIRGYTGKSFILSIPWLVIVLCHESSSTVKILEYSHRYIIRIVRK
jgi:hypothetical protein